VKTIHGTMPANAGCVWKPELSRYLVMLLAVPCCTWVRALLTNLSRSLSLSLFPVSRCSGSSGPQSANTAP